MLQCIENLSLKPVEVNHDRNIIVLDSQWQGFECLVVPLVQSPLLSISSNSAHCVRKVTEFELAVPVESCIASYFTEDDLLPGCLGQLQLLEENLSNNEFCLSVILRVHVSSLSADVSNALIESNSKVLEVSEQLLAVILESLDLFVEVNVLMVYHTVIIV